jgi:hypothetical protein
MFCPSSLQHFEKLSVVKASVKHFMWEKLLKLLVLDLSSVSIVVIHVCGIWSVGYFVKNLHHGI